MTDKCTCGEDGYDECCCPVPEPEPYQDEVVPRETHYCRSCLRAGELSRLIKKKVKKWNHREWYCRRCAEQSGAGYYGDVIAGCGYGAAAAKKALTKTRNRAKKRYDAARASFVQLRKDAKGTR
ncbi:hypothetical protein LCGC14_1004300 [marine sediment metagenome]|uniref:Uncharacterized protein n=1 Tax=marine sediment metagenome TaxID=412755 RepID=A0A0F9R895_9ZZZZ